MAVYGARGWVGGVCVCVCVCVLAVREGGVEEEDFASNFLPHPLDAALNSSLPSEL